MSNIQERRDRQQARLIEKTFRVYEELMAGPHFVGTDAGFALVAAAVLVVGMDLDNTLEALNR